jgi:hypothetical protein
MAATANANQTTASKMAEEASKRFEQNSQRVREINAAVTDSAKAGSRVVIDNYEKAAKSVFEMQRTLVGTSQVEWVKSTSNTQITFAEDVSQAWVKAARELLK